MQILKQIKMISTKVDKILCDICGEEIKENEWPYRYYIDIEYYYPDGAYGESIKIDCCENCFNEKVSTYIRSIAKLEIKSEEW